MAFKKRSKIKSEFSMASLTDMIFLLLIFFVLNSSIVAPNSLNLLLPGSSKAQTQVDSKTDNVAIGKGGELYLNGKRIAESNLEETLSARASKTRDMNLLISPDKGVAVKHVAMVMDICLRLQINAILAAEK